MLSESRISLVVLDRRYTDKLSYYDDWLDAVCSYPGFDAEVCNIATSEGRELARSKFNECDVIVALHSTTSDNVVDLCELLPHLQSRTCLFAAFVGNEVNLPAAPMTAKFEFLRKSAVDLVISQLLPEAAEWYYAPLGCQVLSLPHALNPLAYEPGGAHPSRELDVGARSHRYPPHVGDRERLALFEYFQEYSNEFNLKSDVQLGGERFDRVGWAAFLRRSRATLATEAGTLFLDRDDSLIIEVQRELRTQITGKIVISQNSFLRNLYATFVPDKLRELVRERLTGLLVEDYNIGQGAGADAEICIVERVFLPHKKAPFYTKAISSRHFDAIGCQTAQIMYEGRYNDILAPWKNYVELKKDFSNIDQVVLAIKDSDYLDTMTSQTREYALDSHTHYHRMQSLENRLRGVASGAQ